VAVKEDYFELTWKKNTDDYAGSLLQTSGLVNMCKISSTRLKWENAVTG
jgi:hypothetical protein